MPKDKPFLFVNEKVRKVTEFCAGRFLGKLLFCLDFYLP
jgi:hypothetical protein